ncbi:MAG: PPA1309 family protein, partial [Candidatus Nanopelagicales bacterium]
MDSPDLFAAAMDIEGHVASQGWDQPALLFALVPTEQVRADQPELAAQLGVSEGGPALTTFEQPAPPDKEELDEFLARIQWPAEIVGAALVVERLVLPPEAEAQIADRPDAAAAAREHPDARDMRIVAAVTRDGDRM